METPPPEVLLDDLKVSTYATRVALYVHLQTLHDYTAYPLTLRFSSQVWNVDTVWDIKHSRIDGGKRALCGAAHLKELKLWSL